MSEVREFEEIAGVADVAAMLTPDMARPPGYRNQIEPQEAT